MRLTEHQHYVVRNTLAALWSGSSEMKHVGFGPRGANDMLLASAAYDVVCFTMGKSANERHERAEGDSMSASASLLIHSECRRESLLGFCECLPRGSFLLFAPRKC